LQSQEFSPRSILMSKVSSSPAQSPLLFSRTQAAWRTNRPSTQAAKKSPAGEDGALKFP
jgi:hypothetical protein